MHAGFLLDLLERRELFGELLGVGLRLGSLGLGTVELEGQLLGMPLDDLHVREPVRKGLFELSVLGAGRVDARLQIAARAAELGCTLFGLGAPRRHVRMVRREPRHLLFGLRTLGLHACKLGVYGIKVGLGGLCASGVGLKRHRKLARTGGRCTLALAHDELGGLDALNGARSLAMLARELAGAGPLLADLLLQRLGSSFRGRNLRALRLELGRDGFFAGRGSGVLFLQLAQIVDGELELQIGELGGKPDVGAGTLRLALERLQLALDLGGHVAHAREMLVHLSQLALAFRLALLVLERSRGLFDERATVLGLRLQYGVEAALRDDRVRARPKSRVVKNVEHVHATRHRAVDEVFALSRAVHAASNRDLVIVDGKRAVGVVEHQVDFCKPRRASGGGAGEDDVFHGLPTQMLGVALAEHPQHGIRDVRFSRSVRAHDRRDARLERERASVGKGLEALEDEGFEVHSLALLLLKACSFLLGFDASALGGLLGLRVRCGFFFGSAGGCLLGLGLRRGLLLGGALLLGEPEPEELAEARERALRSLALGLLLRATGAAGKSLVTRVDLSDERAVVRRALRLDQLVSRRDAALLELLLKGALGVFGLRGQIERHMRDERAAHELHRSVDSAVKVERGNDRLIDVLERGVKASLARARLRGAEHDDVGETELRSHIRKARARDERHLDAGKPALVDLVEAVERDRRDDGAHDGVAQEFQALVGVFDRTALRRRRVRDRRKEQLLLLEFVAQDFLGACELFLLFFSHRHADIGPPCDYRVF